MSAIKGAMKTHELYTEAFVSARVLRDVRITDVFFVSFVVQLTTKHTKDTQKTRRKNVNLLTGYGLCALIDQADTAVHQWTLTRRSEEALLFFLFYWL